MKIIETKNYQETSLVAADILAEQVRKKENSVLGLATGSSPEGMYSELIKMYKNGEVDFSKVISVNLDEYFGLGPDNNQSYRYFMNKHLFDHVNIRKEYTYVPDGLTKNPEQECKAYDQLIEDLGGIDLQVLGMGLNGHIGFNEPADYFTAGTHLVCLEESTIEANSRFFASKEEVPTKALSMGLKSILSAKKILLIVHGKAKQEILMKAIHGPVTPQLPASILQLHPNVTVVCSFNE
ncbi:MAG: glucosamine-6-phosphate deaminase [Clostridia bacterium]|nr:glucosamine-6-phosphate deaminase [Clostridia bacterium]